MSVLRYSYKEHSIPWVSEYPYWCTNCDKGFKFPARNNFISGLVCPICEGTNVMKGSERTPLFPKHDVALRLRWDFTDYASVAQMHKSMIGNSIIEATLKLSTGEVFEYVYISETEFQFYLRGNMPINYLLEKELQ